MSAAGNFSDVEVEAVEAIKRTLGVPSTSSVEVDDESLKNAGFCSTLKAVRFNEDLEVVLKCAPCGRQLREAIPFDKIFQREIYVYEEVVPIFKGIQPWDALPKCYHSCKEPFKEVLVLENLKAQGYELWPRHQEMDGEHLRLVLKEYARLHAFSLALRAHKPEVLGEIERNTGDIYMGIIKKCGTAETIRNLSQRAWKEFSGGTCPFDIIAMMEQLVAPEAAGNYGVLCHGDTWCNNILFKYQNSSCHPTSVKLLDFQLARFGSPVLDLSYFLYSSASLEDLNHLDQLLRCYHEALVVFLKESRCDAPLLLFPYEILEDHWRRFAKFGLGMAFLVVNVMMMDDSELPDVNDNRGNGDDFIGSFEKQSKNDKRYVEKMVGILRHFEERRLL